MNNVGVTATLGSPSSRRAWIEIKITAGITKAPRSPSSRRAWIEIFGFDILAQDIEVALLAEGVDRNSTCSLVMGRRASSPSSRRAWIEMIYTGEFFNFSNVALLAEGVDRNA